MSNIYGEQGIELLRELKRTEAITAYNGKVVQQVSDEINGLFSEIQSMLKDLGREAKSEPFYFSNLVVLHTSIQRNKRVVLAYLHNRLNRIKDYRWDLGPVLSPEIKENFSPKELDFFSAYNDCISAYSRETNDVSHPPRDLFIEIRVLKTVGEVMTESGPVNLVENTVHFLKRTDVEMYIRQGQVEHIV